MLITTKQSIVCYSESEAADELGLSLPQLHKLLDENIFNDGSFRPDDLTFTPSDMLLLRFWSRGQPNPKVLRMPRRY